MNTNAADIFYSLDIETSGFDPETSEILEVGIVGFTIDTRHSAGHASFLRRRVRIVEEWSRVFRPRGEVHPRILGLTGISQKELDGGAAFDDHRKFLQDKLGNATIVGHNVGFDIKFLEKSGIVFSGKVVDTMSLVQFLLPTHHSYNLENLMHLFQVPHKEAHRALADAKATVKLLEKLVGVYLGLPDAARRQVQKISAQVNAPWAELFVIPTAAGLSTGTLAQAEGSLKHGFAAKHHKQDSSPVAHGLGMTGARKPLTDNTIYLAPPFTDPVTMAEQVINQTDERLVIVVPGRHQVLELWKRGKVRGVFSPRFMFDKERFEALLEQGAQNLDQAIFLLKLVVWQAVNWQQECLLDLNLSFAGGQFKESVVGSPLPESAEDRVLCCDQQTFLELQGHPVFSGRALVVAGLADLERSITLTIGEKSSWGYVSFLLRSFYNPETETGNAEFKEVVIQGLAATDLFFGLAVVLLEKLNRGLGEIAVNDHVRNSLEFVRVAQAAEHFCQRLMAVNATLRSKDIADFCRQLANFFIDQPHFVKWADIGERTCSFHSLPLEIKQLVANALSGFAKVYFVEPQTHPIILDHFRRRLGLEAFAVSMSYASSPSWFKKVLRLLFPVRPVCLLTDSLSLAVNFTKRQNLPAAVILDTSAEVSESYRTYYQVWRKHAFVLAEQAGGGINKLFRNFGIRSNSLLLVSGKTVLSFLRGPQQVRPISRLGVKVVALSEPLLPKKHNLYTQALAAQYPDPEKELFLPRALYDMHSILQFFHSKRLKRVFVAKPGKSFKYSQLLAEFLGHFYEVKQEK